MSEQFKGQLTAYKNLIDQAILEYVPQLTQDTDEKTVLAAQAYVSILERGGKRIRGALTMCGYQMFGGTDQKMILQAAQAVEMMHAYILIIDDIQDRSELRRGGPTAHKILSEMSKSRGWKGNHEHTGLSLALNAALIGNHSAQNVFSNLATSPETRLKILDLMNSAMVTTAHGQTGDIINEISGDVTEQDIYNVLLRKTAHYTVLNPLQIGMTLAGAGQSDIEKISEYSLAVGYAFQVTDDLLLFSDDSGDKDLAGDIKEGKMTVLTTYALAHADVADAEFLQSCLGNHQLTVVDFDRCKRIIEESGARSHAKQKAEDAVRAAQKSAKSFPETWDKTQVQFLNDLASYLLDRKK